MNKEKRLLIYDNAESSFVGFAWKAGAKLLASKFTNVLACNSWEDCIKQLAKLHVSYDQVQFWGHGSPGKIYINGKVAPQEFWSAIVTKTKETSDVWLRVCSFFCTKQGKDAAIQIVKILKCRLIANTYIIGKWGYHSGLHSLKPNQLPLWADSEGVNKNGDLKSSGPFEPHSVLATTMKVPDWTSNK